MVGVVATVRGELICTDPFSQPNPTLISPLSTNAVMIGDVVASSGSQCNADNRPPTPAPYARDGSGRQLNLNQILRNERTWRARSRVAFSSNPFAIHTATYQRLYQNHKTGAQFDVKSNDSEWDGDMAFGNFLYGAVLHTHGFSLSAAQRYAAAYQAVQDNGNELSMGVITQGIYNYVTNSGDSPGDDELIAKGWRYAREVHSQNPSDSKSLSCIDERTLSQSSTPGTGGNGGGGDGGSGMGGGGTLWSSCELWYFPSGLTNGMFYMEKNCQFWMIP